MQNDNLSTTTTNVSLVLLAPALAKTRCGLDLSAVTDLPIEFAENVVKMMDTSGLWSGTDYHAISKILTRHRPRAGILSEGLGDLIVALGNSCWTDDLDAWLEICREHITCGGGLQPYLDHVLVHEAKLQTGAPGIYHRTLAEPTIGGRLEDARMRVGAFVSANPDHGLTVGDDAATTYGCIGLVLLAIAITGSRSPNEISEVTGFLRENERAILKDAWISISRRIVLSA